MGITWETGVMVCLFPVSFRGTVTIASEASVSLSEVSGEGRALSEQNQGASEVRSGG